MPDDPYVYPETNTLRNLRNLRDENALQAFETRASFARLRELHESPVKGEFDRRHLQAIHAYIFQDVYAWAGKTREGVEIAKPGAPTFAFSRYIDRSLDVLFTKLSAEHHLYDLDVEAFSARAGWYLGEMNAVHPFREGNGRAQREFVRELGQIRGHFIDWSRVSREVMYGASQLSFLEGDPSGLASAISSAIVS